MCVFESRSSDQPNSGEAFDQDRAEGPSGDRCRAENVGAVVWAHIHLPVVQPDGWSDYHLRMGMRELERLRRETEAAMALLTGAMPESRDTVADIARNAGISNREARRRKSVADVCGKVKGAFEKLKSGAISNEHVSALAPVADMPGAEGLLDDAASKSPEELARDVEEFRLSSACGEDMAKRQRTRRSLRFSSGPGINGLLPPVEGTELKNRLAAMVDAKWRAAHPTRAKELGGHGGDSHDQRMADALLEMAGVRSGQEGYQNLRDSHNLRDSQNSVPREATQSPGSTEVAEVADLSEGSSRKTSACDQTNRPGQTPGTPKADQENRPRETTGTPKADQENRPGETAGAPKADQANRPREAVSMNVGLRLAGLGGRMIQEEPPDGSCANGPPGAGATTVKTGNQQWSLCSTSINGKRA